MVVEAAANSDHQHWLTITSHHPAGVEGDSSTFVLLSLAKSWTKEKSFLKICFVQVHRIRMLLIKIHKIV